MGAFKPLEGLKVVEWTSFIAAPTCGRMLADWGADVIKVEPLCLCIHEVVLVSIEDLSFNSPMVVDEVGVIEIHAPPFPLWRKTAEE